jgi:NTE family protein
VNFHFGMMVLGGAGKLKTALVFSAGGMFGAWQAGVWRALAGSIAPDLIVGASVGSLNGWAIAGGCPPADLEQHWLELGDAGRLRFRFPRSPLHGLADGRALERTIRALHTSWPPQVEFAAVLTDLLKFQPRIFRNHEVTAEHLLASCAVPAVFDQRRIGGRVYSDGGLLNPLPCWAAIELGAERIIALDAMPRIWRRRVSSASNIIRIVPSRPLGPIHQLLHWDRGRIEQWLEQGRADGEKLKHSIQKCFEREYRI